MFISSNNKYKPSTTILGPKLSKAPTASDTQKPSQQPKESFNESEQQALEEWNGRLHPYLGQLKTPPAGQSPQDFSVAHEYVVDTLYKLAGEEIDRQGLELHVEIFSGDVPQASLDDDPELEEIWKEDNPGKEWPIRGWLGIPSDSKKPIYRMVLNAGLLNALESQDELAFVLAQQTERLLDHDKKDPYNDELLLPESQSFLFPQEMQTDADVAAIARMSKAGFNPKAAFSAISKLYNQNPVQYPENDLHRGLKAAADGHEHEGMRVGLIQAEVERYIRREDPSTAVEPTPLPNDLKISVAPGYEKRVENLEEFKGLYQNLAINVAGDETPAWMFHDSVPPEEYSRIVFTDASSEDNEQALLAAVDALDSNQSITSEGKVNGFLRILLALDGGPVKNNEPLSNDTQANLSAFLQKHSGSWDASKFLASLTSDDQVLHQRLVREVVYAEDFQKLAAGSLSRLAEAAPQAWITGPNNAQENLDTLPELITKNHSDGQNAWPFGKIIDGAVINLMQGLDAKALAAEKGSAGAPRSMILTNDILSLDKPTPEYQLELRQAATSMIEATNEVREDQARLRLRLPYSEPKQLNAYLQELGESENWSSFTEDFQKELPLLLKDLATMTSTQEGMIYDTSRPQPYPEKLESRFAELLDGDASQREAAIKHFSRHINHAQKVKGRTPRRQWLKKAALALAEGGTDSVVASLTKPERSQYSKLIHKTLTDGYQLKPEDLPDTSTPSLVALNERIQNGEFEIDMSAFPDHELFRKAKEVFLAGKESMADIMTFVSPVEARLVLGEMAILGHDKEVSQSIAKGLKLDSFVNILESGEEAVTRAETLREMVDADETEHVGSDAGAFLLDGFLAVQNQVEDLETWHDLAVRSIDFSNGGLQARVNTKRSLGKNLFARLEGLEPKVIREWLAKDKVMDLLSPGQSSDLLVKVLGEHSEPGKDLGKLTFLISELDADFNLRDEHPVAFNGMRDQVTEKARLQPHNVDLVFPQVDKGVTTTSSAYSNQARALSGLLAVARERSPEEQIETIEYLMGRQQVMPAYLEEASDGQKLAPLTESLQTTRQELLDADTQTRVMVANSFLAGPSGILRSEEGQEAVINYFLKNLDEQNRELGDKIARGVLYSQGDADTLAVAFILGQKPEEPKEGQDPGQAARLDEATILNRLFDAYGVPGIKMKQYLAFTSEFSKFKDVFESAQDSAMPLNYYQVLKLVQKRFGEEWPQDLEIDRVLGSGSVNVAIRYRNEQTGEREVVSLGREDIEESTNNDFERFNKFIGELTKTPEDRENFGYVLGLLDLIKQSVALEFEKEQAMAVQQQAYKTYRHEINGWTIKSIDAHSVKNLGLFMQEAKGKTARKTYVRDPETYREAMKAMSAAEFGVLKGQTSRNNWRPEALFANPDFHDGQVLIDKENKTATILDFGQAVPITNAERVEGMDLLTIIGKGDSAKAAAKRLNKRYFGRKKVFTPEDMEPILKRTDRMDIFIHLLSALSLKGADVPLSSVHWILGINRQMALGEKIGKPIDKDIRNMVITHKVGLPLSVYNTAEGTVQTAKRWGKVAIDTAVKVGTSIAHTIGGWFGWGKGSDDSEDKPQDKSDVRVLGNIKLDITPDELKAKIAKLEEEKEKAPEVTYKAWRPNFR